ncbi:MAG TPA: alpha-hydroxy acid oxidase [Acidobacteriota bacterium]|nr:alpha-hydroxy acid oxidase [Acidobacteriota bacterium]
MSKRGLMDYSPSPLIRGHASIEDLARTAERRIPRFAFDYLEGATGREVCLERNRAQLDAITLTPRFMVDVTSLDLSTELFGQRYEMPFGVAPVGLSGLMWPGTELILAAAAARAGIPYCLSTLSTVKMEEVAAIAGSRAWFQLYVTKDTEVAEDLVRRAGDAGFGALIVTIDVPAASRRERDIRNGLSLPPRMGLETIYRAAVRPAWVAQVLRNGRPKFHNVAQYAPAGTSLEGYVKEQFLHRPLSWRRIEAIRAQWSGPLVLKGILHPDDARRAVDAGADGLIISNHGGRQLDAAPTPLDVLPAIQEAVGDRPTLMVDSGIMSGLDVARCLARGAQFVFCGRAFVYGVAALGKAGGDHAVAILREGLQDILTQIGCASASDLDARWL